MKTVYLAGPITGLSFKGCTDWREQVCADLNTLGIKGLSPMRAKDYLAHLDNISGTGEEYGHLGVLSTPRGVITRDHYDCTTCDVLLVNLLGAKQVSIGTVAEIAWAWMKRTPIVIAIEPKGNIHEHMFILEMTGFRVESLQQAVATVGAILS